MTLKRRARAAIIVAVLLALTALLSLCTSTVVACPAVEARAGAATLATWNIRHLGHGKQKDFEALGRIVREASFDFLALQEVMTEQGLAGLRESVETATGACWETSLSHAVGSDARKEMYAFLWNPAVIEYVDGAVVYTDSADQFVREPYSARFRIRHSGLTFVAANVHVLHGDKQSERTPEIKALAEYWDWLQRDVYPADAERILLMGDFNLKPSHPAWALLRAVAEPLITEGETTLSSKDGEYANLYDNVWIPSDNDLSITDRGIFKFPATLGLTHEQSRKHVSDHAPVWLKLDPPLPLVTADEQPRAARAPARASWAPGP
jgi:endonuclease/exonuclease/phosphatase family metal-dependent hydrolase